MVPLGQPLPTPHTNFLQKRWGPESTLQRTPVLNRQRKVRKGPIFWLIGNAYGSKLTETSAIQPEIQSDTRMEID